MTYSEVAEKYCADVRDGVIPAGRYVKEKPCNNILAVIYLQSRKGYEYANKNLEVQEVQS